MKINREEFANSLEVYIDLLTNKVKEYMIEALNYQENELEELQEYIEWEVVLTISDWLSSAFDGGDVEDMAYNITKQRDFQDKVKYLRAVMVEKIVEEIVPIEKQGYYSPYDIVEDKGIENRYTRDNMIKWVKTAYRLD